MAPHSGLGGWAPRPRKLSPAAARTAAETSKRGDHDERRDDIRQQVHENDPEMAGARRDRGIEVRLALFHQHDAVGHPRIVGDCCDADRDHGVGQAWTEHRDRRKCDQRISEGEQHVRAAHQDALDPAAGIAAHQPDEQAGAERDADRNEPDLQRQPGPVDYPAQQIATELVGAEGVGRARGVSRRPAPIWSGS